MCYEWKDKVVLITGAATGIGAAVVRIIVNEGVKHVAVVDINESQGIKLQNGLNSKYGANKVKFYKCDVTNDDMFVGICNTVKTEQDYIDVLINNAGIMNDRHGVYKKEIELNMTTLVTGTLKAIEIMRKDKGGRGGAVINISSVAGLLQRPQMPIYYATKSAVLQFSNCIGMNEYYSKTGVRVLAICFGLTDTPLLTKEKFGCVLPEFEENLLDVFNNYPKIQTIASAAQGLVDAYKLGESGSTWLVRSDKPAEEISANVHKAYEILSARINVE